MEIDKPNESCVFYVGDVDDIFWFERVRKSNRGSSCRCCFGMEEDARKNGVQMIGWGTGKRRSLRRRSKVSRKRSRVTESNNATPDTNNRV